MRKYLAWESIVAEKETLNLDPQQLRQAEEQKRAADGIVTARVPETYQWLLVPIQATPQSGVEWRAIRLTGQDALAVRASKKLRSDELLITSFSGTRLRMELDRVPLWPGDHVAIRQLVGQFSSYLYLPRLKDSAVLLGAVGDGVSLLTLEQDTFAFADSFDEAASRYRALRGGESITLADPGAPALLVKPAVARRQLDAERAKPRDEGAVPGGGEGRPGGKRTDGGGPGVVAANPKRFHGTVILDATRVGRDASRVANEVIAHLSGLGLGADRVCPPLRSARRLDRVP